MQVVKDKMGQLIGKHARLADQIQKKGLEGEPQTTIEESIDNLAQIIEDLSQKGEEVQKQIDLLREAKGQEWLVLRPGLNQALEELTQAYDKALTQFVG